MGTEDRLGPEARFSLPDATTTGLFKKLLSNIEYGGAPFSGWCLPCSLRLVEGSVEVVPCRTCTDVVVRDMEEKKKKKRRSRYAKRPRVGEAGKDVVDFLQIRLAIERKGR